VKVPPISAETAFQMRYYMHDIYSMHFRTFQKVFSKHPSSTHEKYDEILGLIDGDQESEVFSKFI